MFHIFLAFYLQKTSLLPTFLNFFSIFKFLNLVNSPLLKTLDGSQILPSGCPQIQECQIGILSAPVYKGHRSPMAWLATAFGEV